MMKLAAKNNQRLNLSLLALCIALGATQAQAQSAAGMIKLLQSGKLPPERQAGVVKLACERGNAEELGYLFSQVVSPTGFGPEAKMV
ncbi:MAG: hypothetical protein K2W93_07275, partial [Burkholderiaceae bacterium]|nr:hypothetical protein [Burkholderiaceae bacterium]